MSANSSVLSKKEEKSKNIQVVVRCRPFNTAERKSSHSVIECDQVRREVNVRTGGAADKTARKTYTFDMVFGPSAKQIEVYRSVVCPILDEVIMGYNCTVFAYGQTGTGKTFTMEGERSPNEEFTWEEDPLAGVIPRTLHQIFEKLSDNGTEFSVKVSLLEIYNEELFDLLSPSTDVTERLQMFDDPRNKRGVIIKGLEEVTVHNKDEVYQILERGAAKRKTASTLMNAYSSRSHSVFSITIHMKETTLDGEELVKIGKLNLVDLAGSENIGRSGAVDKRAREAGNINQSLLTLGRVITALVERTPHVPYRESKLTRILQDSLGGRTKTSIIATVSPASINMEETLSTLEYANRAKNIMNKPEVNQKLTKRALIKEYTEEIERLKRDLASSREKNGVYLSTENFDMMNSKIGTQEEQIAVFTEKMLALEEEMKRVVDMFSDGKRELEQCTEDLREVRSQLDEANRDLQHTRMKLGEEEFIVSQLENTENKLYSTAGELLATVEASTGDVSGLHEKLDRKKAVEQHNVEAQQDFASRMQADFNQMQKSIEEQSAKHQGMLSLYSGSVADLLTLNRTAFTEATSVVASSFKSIKDLVSHSVTKCQADMAQQESLCQNTRDRLHRALEEHKIDMEEGLLAIILPGINAVMEMNETLKQTLQSHSILAEKMESMKHDMASFFTEHTSALAKMRESATEGLRSLQAEQDCLKQQIIKANEKHSTGMSQVISCLQNQLNLLTMETQNDFEGLLRQSDAVQVPVGNLQQDIQLHCTKSEQAVTSCRGLLESTTDVLISEARRTAEEGGRVTEECFGQCSYLKTSVGRLAETAVAQCGAVMDGVVSFAEDQLSMIRTRKASAENMLQSMEASCHQALQQANGQLQLQQTKVEETLTNLEKQIGSDEAVLQRDGAKLATHAKEALSKVNTFLKEGLRSDLSTGRTPQRRDFDYPRVLAKTKNRHELLEHFRKQQQELQEALLTCETVSEEKEEQVDQDSLEDEVCVNNDSVITEHSYYEDNIMCNENGRAPFFKHKRGGKKENKSSLDHSKVENEKNLTPQRSKLPLRVQN
ncbi:kinesin-like protein KIF11 [Paramormyrops kingsleyae]|uniref:Kinesin family member 11 n=1 Tax=Paramormyrops kingsleyae TaxID=1676925 RepID=A0A3B3R6Q3_9TELE|nr:kinesin-like protein KIF11 [Paramormyrops kingsleyae]XP_023686704.1 kinesin-like protein KIF11 [Paramormyrops kingsleyae]XP_023686705.1 kinesin-like protein KIF11 [Paramormyrops kingsleyae]